LTFDTEKLEHRQYPDVYAFRDDVRLVWHNCRTFNPPGESVRKLGDNASDQFELKFSKFHIDASWEGEKRRFALEMDRLEAEAKSLPDKLREVDAELQELTRKVAEREAPPAPGPGRDMTFEEKRKLSHTLGTLPGERLTRVLEIISEGPSAPAPDAEDEYELDIDALDSDTQWKLQAYVDAVSAELAAKAPKPPTVPAGEGGTGAAAAPRPTGSDGTTL
jgi:Bromodomain extra-terminal - transcription regulation/Bromodomain